MRPFLDAIQFVTGPLSLLAFLAVVVLSIYMRSVNDKKGLEYLYKLFMKKLTRAQFYTIMAMVIKRAFWIALIILIMSLLSFLLPSLGNN